MGANHIYFRCRGKKPEIEIKAKLLLNRFGVCEVTQQISCLVAVRCICVR